jgi:hypothetical protein
MLGTFDTPEVAAEMKADPHVVDPFTGARYSEIMAFGLSEASPLQLAGMSKEALRVTLDHFLANFDMLSPATERQVRKLYGVRVHELVVHSNGATIAEALIRRGWMQVDELRILGGDRSLNNLAGLRQLSADKHMRISVYALDHNVIPEIPVRWSIRGWAHRAYQLGESFAEYIKQQVARLPSDRVRSRSHPAWRHRYLHFVDDR